jgi:hypothetical protein
MAKRVMNILPTDNTGRAGREPKVLISFWKKHKVEDIALLSEEQINNLIEEYFTQYEYRNKKNNKKWWYDDQPIWKTPKKFLTDKYKTKYN